MISAQHISPAQTQRMATYDTNLFCRAPLPPTVRRINKSINERLDRYIRAEKLRQAQELWKTKPCPTLTAFEECLRVASQPKPVPQAIYTQQDFIDQLDPQQRADIQREWEVATQPKPQPQPQPTLGWRVITDFPNYEVSTDSQVRNKKTGRVLKPRADKDGYLGVGLRKDNKGHTKRIHRIVGEAFIPNPDGKMVIDHINRDITDNRLENLRWATHSENNLNTGRRSDSTTGYKHINSDNTRDRWRIQIHSHKISRYFSKSAWTLEQVVNIRNNLYEEHGIQRYD